MKLLELRPCRSLFAVISLLACFVPVLASRTAEAQTPDPIPDQNPSKKLFTPETDLSIGIYGQLTNTRMPTNVVPESYGVYTRQIIQNTTDSPGILATFHQSFKPWLGYNVNFGYSRFSENYSYGDQFIPTPAPNQPAFSAYSRGAIPTNMLDLTIAYLFRGPSGKKFSTFGQFGGGGLFFLPTVSTDSLDLSPVRNQTRPAMIFGVGMNYKLTSRLDLRAEYRGFFYKCPDFTLPPYPGGSSFPMTKLFTVTNAPAVSLVYHFGGTKKLAVPAKAN
jgi:opacity protein-like surface antigen